MTWVSAPGCPTECPLTLKIPGATWGLLKERHSEWLSQQQNRTSLSWRARTQATEFTHRTRAQLLGARVRKGFQHSLVVLLTPLQGRPAMFVSFKPIFWTL